MLPRKYGEGSKTNTRHYIGMSEDLSWVSQSIPEYAIGGSNTSSVTTTRIDLVSDISQGASNFDHNGEMTKSEQQLATSLDTGELLANLGDQFNATSIEVSDSEPCKDIVLPLDVPFFDVEFLRDTGVAGGAKDMDDDSKAEVSSKNSDVSQRLIRDVVLQSEDFSKELSDMDVNKVLKAKSDEHDIEYLSAIFNNLEFTLSKWSKEPMMYVAPNPGYFFLQELMKEPYQKIGFSKGFYNVAKAMASSGLESLNLLSDTLSDAAKILSKNKIALVSPSFIRLLNTIISSYKILQYVNGKRNEIDANVAIVGEFAKNLSFAQQHLHAVPKFALRVFNDLSGKLSIALSKHEVTLLSSDFVNLLNQMLTFYKVIRSMDSEETPESVGFIEHFAEKVNARQYLNIAANAEESVDMSFVEDLERNFFQCGEIKTADEDNSNQGAKKDSEVKSSHESEVVPKVSVEELPGTNIELTSTSMVESAAQKIL